MKYLVEALGQGQATPIGQRRFEALQLYFDIFQSCLFGSNSPALVHAQRWRMSCNGLSMRHHISNLCSITNILPSQILPSDDFDRL